MNLTEILKAKGLDDKATVTIIVKETTPTVTESSTDTEGTVEQG